MTPGKGIGLFNFFLLLTGKSPCHSASNKSNEEHSVEEVISAWYPIKRLGEVSRLLARDKKCAHQIYSKCNGVQCKLASRNNHKEETKGSEHGRVKGQEHPNTDCG